MKFVEFASKVSYGDAGTEFETATGIYVPKRTIHTFVQELAPMLFEADRTVAEAVLIIGDSTKVRDRASREMNHVRVLISGWAGCSVSLLASGQRRRPRLGR